MGSRVGVAILFGHVRKHGINDARIYGSGGLHIEVKWCSTQCNAFFFDGSSCTRGGFVVCEERRVRVCVISRGFYHFFMDQQ